MFPGRAVDAAGAVGCRAAPDALVRAGAMTVLACRGMDTSRPIGRRAAPFAVLLVIAMLVLPRRRVDAPAPVARRSAMPAFCTHDAILLQMNHRAMIRRLLVLHRHDVGRVALEDIADLCQHSRVDRLILRQLCDRRRRYAR